MIAIDFNDNRILDDLETFIFFDLKGYPLGSACGELF